MIDYLILLKDTLYRAENIRKRALKLKSRDYPSTYPTETLEFVASVSDKIKSELKEIYNRIESGTHPSDFSGPIISLWGSTKDIAGFFQHIENCGNEDVPWSLIHPFEEIFHKSQPGDRLVIAAQHDYNYNYKDILEFFKSWLGTFGTKVFDDLINKKFGKSNKMKNDKKEVAANKKYIGDKKGDWKLNFILFPKIERNSVFQHVLMGHEIGHRFAPVFIHNFDKKKRFSSLISKACKDIIHDAINRIEQDPQYNEYNDEQKKETILRICNDEYSHFMNLLYPAISELFCDVFCLYLFGMAGLFALYCFSGGFPEIDKIMGTYPPWRYRLRVLHDLTTKSKFRKEFDEMSADKFGSQKGEFEMIRKSVKERLTTIKEIIKNKSDIEEIRKSDKHLRVYEIIDKSWNYIYKEVTKMLKGYGPSALEFDHELIFKLVIRLKERITPNEIGSCIESTSRLNKEITFRHIILAGWIYKISYLETITSPDEYLEKLKISNRLILKAIELSDISRRWYSHKEEEANNVSKGSFETKGAS